jgi:hypothetical protein
MNMRNRSKISIPLTALAVILVSLSSPLQAAIAPAGNVILANGPFVAIQSDRSARSLARGSEFYQGDKLWTGPRTRAQIRFSDGAIMTLRPDTEFSVDEYEFDDKDTSRNTSLFTLIKGGFRTITGLIAKLRPDNYKVKTSYAIVGVRGTTIEAVIQGGAFYVGVWQGTVSINTNKDEILLGFGQDFNYARVTSINSAPKGLVQTPPQFQLNLDPDLQEGVVDPTQTRLVTGLLEDGIDPRLSAAEVASLDQLGFATAGGSQLSAVASDGSTGSPIFFDVGQDVVLRQGSAPASGVATTTIVGFPVSFGAWNASVTNPAIIQPDSANAGLTNPVTTDVFWVTMLPPTTLPSGRVYLSFAPTNLTGVGSGSGGGPVNFVSFQADLDFAGGTLSNGNLQLFDGGNNWSADFAGQVAGPTWTANVTGGVVSNGTTCTPCTPQGSLTGGVTGPNAEGIGGVFDFTGGPEFVSGAFIAQ